VLKKAKYALAQKTFQLPHWFARQHDHQVLIPNTGHSGVGLVPKVVLYSHLLHQFTTTYPEVVDIGER